jgi:hypothetical protein
MSAAVTRADGGGVDHVTLMQGELAPGAERVYQLKFGEGPLREGWLFALVGQVRSGAAALTLLDPSGQTAGQWRWETGAKTRWEGLSIPRDGDYRVRVASVGAEALRYTLYYDQSCFCAGKKMPLEGGVVIFQGSATPGTPVEAWLGINDGMETSVEVAYRSAPAGRWPGDYTLIDITPQTDTQSETFRQDSLAFTSKSADPYFVIVTSNKGTGGISFLAQQGGGELAATSPAPASSAWLLYVAAAAGVVALSALALAARAGLRRKRAAHGE